MEDISRKEITETLGRVNMAVSHVTMTHYSNMGLIDQPSQTGKGRGVRAFYPKDTVEKIFALHNLMSLRKIPIEKIKFIVRVGDHLEKQKYTSYMDVINDETDDTPLSFRMGEFTDLAFFTIEYLRLKNFARDLLRPDKHSLQPDRFESLSDKQILYKIIAGPAAEKEPVKFVTQALLIAIASNDETILSKFS